MFGEVLSDLMDHKDSLEIERLIEGMRSKWKE